MRKDIITERIVDKETKFEGEHEVNIDYDKKELIKIPEKEDN
mgnify:FL=1